MKILITNGHLGIGGVEKSLVDLLKSIDYSRHQVDLLLFEGLGEYLPQIPSEVNIILCDLRPTYGSFKKKMIDFISKKEFRNIVIKIILMLRSRISVKCTALLRVLNITDREYDCAIAYRVGISNDYISFCVSAKRKYMWWHHGEFEYGQTTVKNWKCALKNINSIVCVSNATKELITPRFPEKKDDILVLPNMIIVDELIQKGKAFHPYKADKENFKIVSVGRLSAEKRMINIIYVMDDLIQLGYKKIKWYIVGDGIERENIEKEILKKNLQKNIICVGSQKNPYPYIADADLYVHPSYVESQGLTILEAMTLGIPCVVTKSRGPCEFIQNEKNGLLVEPSPEALFEGVKQIIDDKNLFEVIKNNTSCPEYFRQECIIDQFECLINC
ncbi:glycosyltransferase [Faecalimonas hominis]